MKNKIIILSLSCGILLIGLLLLNIYEKAQWKDKYMIQVGNVKELLQENTRRTELILTYQQAQEVNTLRLDSLVKAMGIKPKTVVKTIEKTVIQTDTIVKEIQVLVKGKDRWEISDKDKCFDWKGVAYLKDDSLKVDRVLFDYHNKTTDIYYKERPGKFLFIRYGKKKIYVKSVSECGESYTREISIVKK